MEPTSTTVNEANESKIENNNLMNDKIFWLQIGITIFFGIATYYLVMASWPYFELPFPAIASLGDLVPIVGLYLILLLVVPFLLYYFLYRQSLWKSFISPLKNLFLSLLIYGFLAGLVYLLNI